MPKIKLTKTELKSQRDSLKQFTRFLPTLQLKKQQLQMEMRKCEAALSENRQREQKFRSQLTSWLALFGSPTVLDMVTAYLHVEAIETETQNIAGVNVPVYTGIRFQITPYDLFQTDPWLDDVIKAISELICLREEAKVIQEQYRLIGHELRVTTQRVNLFEKVKIPECRDNIRTIQIYLGDMDTAAVGRSKIAKRKIQEAVA